MRGNCVRNGRDTWPETCKMCLPKSDTFENICLQLYNIEHYGIMECMMIQMKSTAFGRNCPSESESFCCTDSELNEYVHIDYCSHNVKQVIYTFFF